MNLKYFSIICISAALISCGGEKMKPEAYNDALVSEQINVVEAADRLQAGFDTYIKDDMQTLYNRYNQQVETSLEKVNEIGNFDGDETFLNATVKLLEVYNALGKKEYLQAKEILSKPDSLYSKNDEARIELLFKQIDRTIQKATETYQKEQEKFAQKYKIQLIPDSVTTK
jgi:hypothetical protein